MRKCCKWSCLYSVVPTGAPRTMSPCSCLGWLVLPTHTSGPRVSMLGGCWPLAFHIRVFPLLRRMWACACKWCAKRSYTQAASKSWSELCLRRHWNVAQYFATLPGHRWIKRILAWQPAGHKRVGRPKYCWDTMLTKFCRLKGLASWEEIATDADFWNSLLPEFLAFNLPNVM